MLVEARQAQQLSLVALSQRLHMGLEQLQALEEANQQRLPEPVFVIAQARRLAGALGIDISAQIEALRRSDRFNAGQPALKGDVFRAAAIQRAAAAPDERPAGAHKASQAKSKPSKAQASSVSAHGAAGRGLGPAAVARPLAWLLLLAGLGVGGTWLWQQRHRSQPLLSSLSRHLAQQAGPSRPVVPAPPAAAKVKKALPAAGVITLKAAQPSWLEVRAAGQAAPLFRGRFRGERQFPIGAGLRLRAGRPDLVLMAQGSAPAKPLGTISQIRWVTVLAAKTQGSGLTPGMAKPLKPANPSGAVQPQPAAAVTRLQPASPLPPQP
ncbi:MAG: helix-turn-helix domain-containing protein [Cyanobacteriota bacterium]|nr:helix-turn-helix domain-containing protein [Cyanobacteriota bacterium]